MQSFVWSKATLQNISNAPIPRAHISQPDGTFGMKVKRCFSFSDQNSTVELVDERGCPEPTIMSEFRCWMWSAHKKSTQMLQCKTIWKYSGFEEVTEHWPEHCSLILTSSTIILIDSSTIFCVNNTMGLFI